MNSNLQLEHARGPQNGATGSRHISVSRDETRTANGDPPIEPVNWQIEHRDSKLEKLLPALIPARGRDAIEPKNEAKSESSNARRLVFRCVRLTLAGALVTSAIAYTRTALTTVRSEEAYINGEITALRAPIAGEVRRHAFTPGTLLPVGTVFFVENPRYGNEQALSQLNFVTELAQRLRSEAEEATVRHAQQEHLTQLHERMYGEQIIPRLELLEEQMKLQVAGTVMTNKLTLAKKAEERVAELNRQVKLQQSAAVNMPFDGVVWSSPAKDGAQVAAHETVAEVIDPKRIWVDASFHERHAGKLEIGCVVNIQT
ncbi:MAG: efflux RND transporter periplasmic adaptor subunit, partial [Limisphaerales bacterium]